MHALGATMFATLAAAAVLAVAPFTTAPPQAPAPTSTVTARGALCNAGITCASARHTRRGLHRPFVINCGTYNNPEPRNHRLYRGQSSHSRAKCGTGHGDRVNAIYLGRRFDFVDCTPEGGHIQCYPWRTSTGWHFIRRDWNHPEVHLVWNGHCVDGSAVIDKCGPDVT